VTVLFSFIAPENEDPEGILYALPEAFSVRVN
jgi:hypothetical protein